MAVMDEQSVNPLIDAIHGQRIDRPDSIHRRTPKGRSAAAYPHFKRDWHPVAAAVAMLGSLLSEKGHRWRKGQKLMYRKAILSVKHPCCPTCGKPMAENVITTLDGMTRKSWYCAEDQNF